MCYYTTVMQMMNIRIRNPQKMELIMQSHRIMKTTTIKCMTLCILLLLTVVLAGCGDYESSDTIDEDQFYFTITDTNGDNSEVYGNHNGLLFTLVVYTSENLSIMKSLENGDITAKEDFFSVYTDGDNLYVKPSMDNLSVEVNETTKGPYIFRYRWDPYTFSPGKYYTRFVINYKDGSKKGIIRTKEFFAKFEIR